MVLIYYLNHIWVESCDYSFEVVDKFMILFAIRIIFIIIE